MPGFVSWAKELRQRPAPASAAPDSAGGAAAAGSSGRGRLLLLLLALVAASAAVAAAALNGWARHAVAAWGPAWRRRWHRSGATAVEEGLELLRRRPESGSSSGSSGVRQRQGPRPPEVVPGRARLKALAQRQLGAAAIRSGRSEEEVLSVLQGAAHNFPAASAGRRSGRRSDHRSQPAHTAGSSGPPVQTVQPLGRPTESLRISSADLQVGPKERLPDPAACLH